MVEQALKEPPFCRLEMQVGMFQFYLGCNLILYTLSNPEKRYLQCKVKHTFSQSDHSFCITAFTFAIFFSHLATDFSAPLPLGLGQQCFLCGVELMGCQDIPSSPT